MKTRLALCFVFAALLAPPVWGLQTCLVVDIDHMGAGPLEELKNQEPVQFWVEVGTQLLLCGESGIDRVVAATERPVVSRPGPLDPQQLWVARGRQDARVDGAHRVVLREADVTVVEIYGREKARTPAELPAVKGELALAPLNASSVVISQAANSSRRGRRIPKASIAALVAEVDSSRWFGDVQSLAGFNRYSLGDGIFEAEAWLVDELQALPGMVVSTPGFTMGGRQVHNVIGTLTGSSEPDRWFIVGGHYDATSEAPATAAPGAEDNASGCAGVLEMARIFANHPPQATVLFICYVGEEQGLLGSANHANALVASGDDDLVEAVINMDMIGYSSDSVLDCLLETDTWAAYLLDDFADAAAAYTTLSIYTSDWAFGSDHVPYLDNGMAALLTIENEWASYPWYHSTNDLPIYLDLDMGGETLKMNVATLATMIGYGQAHIFADGFESGTTGGWSTAVE